MLETPSQAVVLTAGLGTRLRPLTSVRAKPAIPVAGEPMIRRIIAWLAANGVRDLVLNLHHLPETLTAVVGDGADLDARVRYSWEQPVVLGSAGGPRLALPLIAADTFFIVNGDTITDVDPRSVFRSHAASGARVTLALVRNTEPHRYGGVRLDADGAVTGFVPRGPAAEGSYHFIGVQVAAADVFRPLRDGEPASSIGGVYDDLIRRNPGTVRGFVSEASFWDVGTPADYFKTSAAFSQGSDALFGQRVRIDRSAVVEQSILWDDVVVEAGCRLERCIVTDGVRVKAHSRFRDTVLVESNGEMTAFPIDGGPTPKVTHA
jgi:mannose-1-phosphate guanylyltransferase